MDMNTRYNPYFLVIGLGISGISMAKFLRAKGYNVIATDIDESKKKMAKELNKLGIKTQIGFHDQNTFNRAKTMIPSPGIPLDNTFIQTALNHGVKITSELDIFTKYNDLPIIAITGTNGKTTVTTLIGEILKQSNLKPFVGGNIGTPLVEHLMTNQKADIIVAEISSFQLDIATKFKPDVGVLLNISPDHLDRYESYADYTNSKWSIFKNQDSLDQAVINKTIENFDTVSDKLNSKMMTFSLDHFEKLDHLEATQKDRLKKCNAIINPENITIKIQNESYQFPAKNLRKFNGSHNMENLAASALASLAAGVDFNTVLKGIETFKNLSHRMEFVTTINGISFYNDSKATNTNAVIRAIEWFKKNIILILGGREKGTDFSLLKEHVKKSVKTIISMGETSFKVKDTFRRICPVKIVETMQEGVQAAFAMALKNDIVLLSPACASFDMYDSYAQRGEDFANCVKALKEK
jgi:UDP-N-acetylmuramoylalanine--D-glutamate ligase